MSTLPGLPALHVNPPQQQDPLGELGKAISLRNLGQQGQIQQQEIQQNALQIQDQKAMTAAMHDWDGKDPNELAGLILKHGGSAQAVFGYKEKALQQQKTYSDIAKQDAETGTSNLKNLQTKNDLQLGLLNTVTQGDDAGLPARIQSALQQGTQQGIIDPQHAQMLTQLAQAPPNVIKQSLSVYEKSLMGNKAQLDQAESEAKTGAEKAAQFKELNGQLVNPITGETKGAPLPVDQLNQALSQRWQVMHPGAPLPLPFTLQPNATQKDFDRIDKILEGTEKQQGTKAQQDTANSIRQQTLALTQQKADLTPVIGTDPKTGKDVLVSMDEGQKMGLTGTMKAGEQDVSKAQSARHWIPLATQKGDTPDTMGVLQLIDKLDKEGKLGVIASRWNDFLAGKVGAGDPDFAALRTKMGLSSTLLMNAHVGSRGGSYMLEHFEDLANAGKMDASTLRTGVKSELDYIKSRAMLPADREKSLTGDTAPTKTFQGATYEQQPDGSWKRK